MAAHARTRGGSTIEHLRELARHAEPDGSAGGSAAWQLATAGGARLAADLLILATGNPPPRLPRFVDPALTGRPDVVGNPLAPGALEGVARDAHVLVLGSGLTALDAVSTLLQRGQRAPITVVSRHGLRPRPQPAADELPWLATPLAPFDAPGGPLPPFVAALGRTPRLRALLRTLRERIARDAAAGLPWHAAFGSLRDAVWRFWPDLDAADKQRFVRHLKVWYDVHRFLSPPQNEALVRAAERGGRVRFVAARVQGVMPAAEGPALQLVWQPRGSGAAGIERFDALVNCTGIDGSGAAPADPLLRAMVGDGWLAPGPAGLGFQVDRALRAIGRDGVVHDSLRVVGPPSVGSLGDPIGAGFIAMQIRRAGPDMLHALGAGPPVAREAPA